MIPREAISACRVESSNVPLNKPVHPTALQRASYVRLFGQKVRLSEIIVALQLSWAKPIAHKFHYRTLRVL
jgi:hypothetical protein